jgi:hypothetical protein
MRLQVVADQASSKHTDDSRNRGKGGQPVWRSRRPIVEGMEMRTFGEYEGGQPAGRGTCFALTGVLRSGCGRSYLPRRPRATSRAV